MFERYLAPDERVLDVFRRHQVVLFKPVVTGLAVLGVSAAIGSLAPLVVPQRFSDPFAAAVGIAAIASVALSIWRWSAGRYVITDRRILLVQGVLAKKVTAINLARISDTTYRRSLAGRILGYGELHLDAGGEHGGPAVLHAVPRPDHFYRVISSSVVGPSAGEDRMVDLRRLEDDDTGPLPRVR